MMNGEKLGVRNLREWEFLGPILGGLRSFERFLIF